MKKNIFLRLSAGVLAIVILASAGLAIAKTDKHEIDVDGSILPIGVKYKEFVHYPKEGRQVTIPSCVPTSNDQVADYGQAGWYLNGPRTYKVNVSTLPSSLNASGVLAAFQSAWTTWSAADPNIIASYGGTTAANRAKYDGTNAIMWGRISGGAIAVTYTWYNSLTGAQLESDVIFNSKLKWSNTPYSQDCGGVAGTYDVENIAIHEFGHWIGLDDLYNATDRDLTMYGYGFMAELKKDTLGVGDALGAAIITP